LASECCAVPHNSPSDIEDLVTDINNQDDSILSGIDWKNERKIFTRYRMKPSTATLLPPIFKEIYQDITKQVCCKS
jgi:hypothetical protein